MNITLGKYCRTWSWKVLRSHTGQSIPTIISQNIRLQECHQRVLNQGGPFEDCSPPVWTDSFACTRLSYSYHFLCVAVSKGWEAVKLGTHIRQKRHWKPLLVSKNESMGFVENVFIILGRSQNHILNYNSKLKFGSLPLFFPLLYYKPTYWNAPRFFP